MGGNRLKTEFGYDIPSEHTGEYWAISAHPNGVSYVKNGKYSGFHLDRTLTKTNQNFWTSKGECISFVDKDFGC